MNGFSDRSKPTTDLMAVTFQSMFPAVNVRKAQLDYRRVLLLSRQELENGDEVVYVRHYMVRGRAPTSRTHLKKLLDATVARNGDAAHAVDESLEEKLEESDDEGEESDEDREGSTASASTHTDGESDDQQSDDESDDERTGALGRVLRNLRENIPSATQLRLVELGPRMELTLVKVEQGVCEGKVLFHKYSMYSLL
jgi:ribosome biogenesis protein SSF1/2